MDQFVGGNCLDYFDGVLSEAEIEAEKVFAQQIVTGIASVVCYRCKPAEILSADNQRVVATVAEVVAQAMGSTCECTRTRIRVGLEIDPNIIRAAARTGIKSAEAILHEVEANGRHPEHETWVNTQLSLTQATIDYLERTTSPETVAYRS